MFLSSKEMWDRPLGGTSLEKEIPHWCGNILFVVLGALCKLFWRYRVDGREIGWYNKNILGRWH